MDNHIHFILKPLKNESLSSIMQWVLGVFAQKYNRTFDQHGHVWYDRFKSKIIKDFRQYLHTFIYISNNRSRQVLLNFLLIIHLTAFFIFRKEYLMYWKGLLIEYLEYYGDFYIINNSFFGANYFTEIISLRIQAKFESTMKYWF